MAEFNFWFSEVLRKPLVKFRLSETSDSNERINESCLSGVMAITHSKILGWRLLRMEEIDVRDWQEFEVRLNGLRKLWGGDASPLLFRGQNDSRRHLTTTLEREGWSKVSFSIYYRLLFTLRPSVESLTGKDWDFPSWNPALHDSFRKYDSQNTFPSSEICPFMVYVRHHGFPSPLLDWSSSPYVAAFFAFRNSASDVDTRSIYVFCEAPRRN